MLDASSARLAPLASGTSERRGRPLGAGFSRPAYGSRIDPVNRIGWHLRFPLASHPSPVLVFGPFRTVFRIAVGWAAFALFIDTRAEYVNPSPVRACV